LVRVVETATRDMPRQMIRAAHPDIAQRPNTRLRGSARPGWSAAAWRGVAAGYVGARNADAAQRPYTRLSGSAGPGWPGSGRWRRGWRRSPCAGSHEGCNDALQREEGCSGVVWDGLALGSKASPVPLRATTLYGAVWAGRAGKVRVGAGRHRGRRLRCAGSRERSNEALQREEGCEGLVWDGLVLGDDSLARAAARNDPLRGCVGRPAREGQGRRRIGCVVPVHVNAATRPYNVRKGAKASFGTGWCLGRLPRPYRCAQRPYTWLCGSAGPGSWGWRRTAWRAAVALCRFT